MKIDKGKIKRILFITLSNVGDAVLTMPVLETLKREFHDARVDAFVSPGVKSLFEKDARVSKTFIYNKRAKLFEKYRLIKKLYYVKYDLIVDLKNTMIPLFLWPKYRTSVLRKTDNNNHKKYQHLFRVRELGVNTENALFNIGILPEDEQNARKLLGDYVNKGYIVINPGAKSHIKRWPAEKFGELINLISDRLNINIVIIGKDNHSNSPDNDKIVVGDVLKSVNSPVLNLVDKTNIRELAYIIKNAKAVVTNDSAPLHIASAVNTSCACIFGPTDDKLYGPLSDNCAVIKKGPDCAPCRSAQCIRDLECLENITAEEVFNEVKKLCEYS